MTRPALAAAACAFAVALAACGDDDRRATDPTAAPRRHRAPTWRRSRTTCSRTPSGWSPTAPPCARTPRPTTSSPSRRTSTTSGCWTTTAPRCGGWSRRAQRDFAEANPAYEQMEGVVAGVPSLADYDVIIDAGSDALRSRERRAVRRRDAGRARRFKQPGNFNYLIETSVFGTEPKFAAKGVEPDLDGDGKVEFGEARARTPTSTSRPPAASRSTRRSSTRAARDVAAHAERRADRARGDDADDVRVLRGVEELALRGRRQGVREGLRGGVAPPGHRRHPRRPRARLRQRRAARRQGRRRSRPSRPSESLDKLHAFAAKLRDTEAGGRKYTAEEADTLGSQAQERAEAIAGQITQAAAKLDIQIEEG